jgi:hypothetical protein
MEYSPEEVKVSDPAYIVRKRLGQALEDTDTREEKIENLDQTGSDVDNSVVTNIRSDYEQEMGDVLSDMGGGTGGVGGPQMENPVQRFKQQDNSDLSDEEAKEKMRKFMRVSSLQIAYRGYPVFKSIVMN